jgi:beta-mannosidase
MGPLVTEFGAQGIPEKESLAKFLGKGSIETPDWNDWEYHCYQYNQTNHIAQIPFGKSVDEYIENSQTYQAELIKNAINFYRRKKNNGITGIFQFMFIDCWPSITWSVIDHYRKKKKGFYALKEAYQPVYVSVGMRQKTTIPNTKLNIECWIISDLYRKSYSYTLKVKFSGKVVEEKKTLLKENGIQHIPETDFKYVIPEDTPDGVYDLVFELFDENNNMITVSSEKLEVSSKIIPWQRK